MRLNRIFLILLLPVFVVSLPMSVSAAANSRADPELVFRFDFTSESPTPEKNPRNWSWFYWEPKGGAPEKPVVSDGIADFKIGSGTGGAYTEPVEFDCNAFVCEFEIAEVTGGGNKVVLGFGEASRGRMISGNGFYVRVMHNAVSLADRSTVRNVVAAEGLDLTGSDFKKIRVENFPGVSRITIDGEVVAESRESVAGTARSRFGIGSGWGLPGGKRYRGTYEKLTAKLRNISLYQGGTASVGSLRIASSTSRTGSAFGTPVREYSAFGAPVAGSASSSAAKKKSTGTGRVDEAPGAKSKSVPSLRSETKLESSTKTAVAAESGDNFCDVAENLPGENYNAPWPKSVSAPKTIPARIVKNGPIEWIYESPHFRFISNARISLPAIKEIARIFEGSYRAVLALPLSAPVGNFWQVSERGRFKVKLYELLSQYKEAGGRTGGARGWVASTVTKREDGTGPNKLTDGFVLVPFSTLGLKRKGDCFDSVNVSQTNAGKIAGEVTYLLTNPGSNHPGWLVEGLVDYVRCSYDKGGSFKFGNRRNIGNCYLRSGQRVRLDATFREILVSARGWTSKRHYYYDVSLLLAYYFFHLDGNRDAKLMRQYVRALGNGMSYEDAARVLLNGRSWEELEKEFCRKIKTELGIELTFAQEL